MLNNFGDTKPKLLKLCRFIEFEKVIILPLNIFEKFGCDRRGSHFKNINS